MRFDHIGFVVKSVERERGTFEMLHGPITWSPVIEDPIQDVVALFGRAAGGIVYELLQPRSPGSPVAASLSKKQNIIHHVCYRAPSLAEAAELLRGKGAFPVTEPQPAVAFANAPMQFFLMPGSFLVEVVEGDASPFDFPHRLGGDYKDVTP